MTMTRQQRRSLKREVEKSKGKDVFFYVPDSSEGFYLKLSLTKPPRSPLSKSEAEIYFSKYGVARFFNEDGLCFGDMGRRKKGSGRNTSGY